VNGSTVLPIVAGLIALALLLALILLAIFLRRRKESEEESPETSNEVDAEMASFEPEEFDAASEDGEYINQLSEDSFDLGVNEGGFFDGPLDQGSAFALAGDAMTMEPPENLWANE
jgi:flagellar biosynthesis/type III secretory pathway M-ring protein FliF/YscJ